LRHADSAHSPDKIVENFADKQKLQNLRAHSEPPTIFIPSKIDEENSAPEESKNDLSKITGNSGQNIQKLNRGAKVPPIMVN